MVLVQTQVGQSLAGGNTNPTMRSDKSAAAVVTDAHGKYQEAVLNGNVFMAANQAAQAYTLFSNVTATGLILSNPSGNTKALVILKVGFIPAAAAAGAVSAMVISAGVGQNVTAHTTPLTPMNALVGSNSGPTAKADAAATLPAAGVIVKAFQSPSISVTATTAIPPVTILDVDGLIIVLPGSFVQLAAAVAVPQALIGHIVWEEIPYLGYP